MVDIVGHVFTDKIEAGSMGVVTNTRYIRCIWPRLDKPVSLFAEGSLGITILSTGPARNVVFPDDTIFEECVLDAIYPAEKAVKDAFPNIIGIKNLTPQQSELWVNSYNSVVNSLPQTATKLVTPECYYFKEVLSNKTCVAMLTKQEASDLCKGLVNEETLKSSKEFFDGEGVKTLRSGAK